MRGDELNYLEGDICCYPTFVFNDIDYPVKIVCMKIVWNHLEQPLLIITSDKYA